PKFSDRVKAAQDVGMLVGAYHFLTADDAVNQAHLFLATIDQFVSISSNLAVFVDYEKSKSTPGLHQAVTFMQIVETNIPNCLCGIYSGDLIRETLMPPTSGFVAPNMQTIDTFFASRRLWLAEYGPHERVPWPWSEHPEFCDMWQFNDHGVLKNVIGDVDFSVWNGFPGFVTGGTSTAAMLAPIWKSGRPQPSRANAGAIISSPTNRGEMRA